MKEKLSIRLAKKEDTIYLKKWLNEPGVLNWFPMCNEREIDDTVQLWMSYVSQESVWIADWENEPVGSANLYLQPYKKLAHHSLLAIIVTESMRGKGVGTALLQTLLDQAKNKFHLEFVHLEVYESNPAKRLYAKLGFTEIGEQKKFIKEEGKYFSKIFMEKYL